MKRIRRVKLVREARRAYKLSSVQIALVLAGLSMIQAQILPALQPLVPQRWFPYLTLVISVAIVVARLVQQSGLVDAPNPEADT